MTRTIITFGIETELWRTGDHWPMTDDMLEELIIEADRICQGLRKQLPHHYLIDLSSDRVDHRFALCCNTDVVRENRLVLELLGYDILTSDEETLA